MSTSATPSANEPAHPNSLFLATVDGESVATEPARPFKLTHGSHKDAKRWVEQTSYALDALCQAFSTYDFRPNKDGPGFIPATLLNATRTIPNVDEIFLLVYDIDGGQSVDEVRAILNAQPHVAFLYSTFSHKTTRTEIPTLHYEKWAKQAKLPATTPTLEFLKRYLTDKGKDHLRNVDFDDVHGVQQIPDKGNCWIVTHDAVDKLRVIFPLSEPIKLHSLDVTNPNNAFKTIYHGHGQQLGFNYDHACDDPTRFYYFPSCPKDKAEHVVGLIYSDDQDSLLDWEKITRAKIEEPARKAPPKEPSPDTARAEQKSSGGDFGNLPHWGMLANETFDIEGLLEERLADLILLARSNGGRIITCPFEEEHTEPGGTGTFCVNAESSTTGAWTVYCSHNSCQSAGRKRTDFLHQWLVDGLITLDDLKTYSGVAVPSSKPTIDEVRAKIAATLNQSSTSDDWKPIVDDLVRINDAAFNAEALDAICERTGKKMKGALKESYKQRQKEYARAHAKAQTEEAETTGEATEVRRFYNWDREPFNVISRDAALHLISVNKKIPRLFVRGVDIVRAVTDTTTGVKQISICGLDETLAELERVTEWGKKAKNDAFEGDERDDRAFITKYSPVPKRVGENFRSIEASTHALPYLRDVMDTPYVNANGEVQTEDGYDEISGILLAKSKGLDIPAVSDDPLPEEVTQAVWWLQELYIDFPFSDGETDVDKERWKNDRDYRMTIGKGSRANQIAKTLQPFVSELISGNLMLHAVDKVMRRTGAGYMQDAMAIACFGDTTPVATLPVQEEEIQKTLLTKAMEGAKHITFDNSKEGRVVKSEALASAQTAGKVCGRILGQSRTGSGPWRAVVELNGNGLTLHEDLANRALWVKLDARDKAPELRKGWAHDPLHRWVKENRGQIVWAILTVARAWVVAGKPPLKDTKRILGGFEEYCRVMGGVLDNAGIHGFNSNRNLISIDAAQVVEMQAFMEYVLEVFGTNEVHVGRCGHNECGDPNRFNNYGEKTLVDLLLDVDYLDLGVMSHPNQKSLGNRLGSMLATQVGRPFEINGSDYTWSSRTVRGKSAYRLAPGKGKPEVAPTRGDRTKAPK